MKFISTMLIVACCAVPGIAAARGGGGFVAGGHSAVHGAVGGVHGNKHHVIVRLSHRRLFAVARTRGGTNAFPFGGFPFGVPDSGTGYSNNPVVMLGPSDYRQPAPRIAAEMPPCRETVAGVEIVRGKYCHS